MCTSPFDQNVGKRKGEQYEQRVLFHPLLLFECYPAGDTFTEHHTFYDYNLVLCFEGKSYYSKFTKQSLVACRQGYILTNAFFAICGHQSSLLSLFRSFSGPSICNCLPLSPHSGVGAFLPICLQTYVFPKHFLNSSIIIVVVVFIIIILDFMHYGVKWQQELFVPLIIFMTPIDLP